MPVLRVIFLRHAANRYDAACREMAQDKIGPPAKRPSARTVTRLRLVESLGPMLPAQLHRDHRHAERLRDPVYFGSGTFGTL